MTTLSQCLNASFCTSVKLRHIRFRRIIASVSYSRQFDNVAIKALKLVFRFCKCVFTHKNPVIQVPLQCSVKTVVCFLTVVLLKRQYLANCQIAITHCSVVNNFLVSNFFKVLFKLLKLLTELYNVTNF